MPPRSRTGGSAANGVFIASGDLRDFAADLRRAGQDDLVKDMLKAFKTSAKQVTTESRRVALQTLPSRGGLARLVSKQPQRTVARAGRTTATVAVILNGRKKGSGGTQADAGRVRHPVFDRVDASGKRVFVGQDVRPGWFTRTAEFIAPDVERAVAEAFDDTARRAGFL